MSDDIYSLWSDAVAKTAASVARDFPDVEKEDLIQHLWMKLLENKKYITTPDERGAHRMLKQWARMHAWDARKEHLQLSAQYSYRTSDIQAILATVFDKRDWESVQIPDDAKSEFNDVFLEMNLDVKRGWESLGYAQRKVIFAKYALGHEPNGAAEIKRLYRAICALTDKVNWYQKPVGTDYVGTRRAITNANSRANISHLTD